ncbi:unnamed protein product [Umbelopsis ramanniana]
MADNEQNDMKVAIQQSLKQLENDLEQQKREKEEIRQAIALSLGKPVERLTARETLAATLESSIKRPLDESTSVATESKKQNTGKPSMPTYLDGVVKLTHVKGTSGSDYITIGQVIEAKYLKKALLTAFVVSMDFVEEQFPEHINVCIVMHGRQGSAFQVSPKRIVVNPPMSNPNFGVFHSKLMLLFHQNSLRVVIGSANFVDYDWCELENVLFIQDFPLLPDGPLESADQLPKFGGDIHEQLGLMRVPATVRKELLLYDFSRAKAHIVPSVSGTHEGDERYKVGHTRLCSVIEQLGLQQKQIADGPKVELQTSSLGAMTVPYLQELYLSFCGINTFTPEGSNIQKAYKKNGGTPPVTIVYPSTFTIDNSNVGREGASTICFNTANWKKPTFPRGIMRDAVSNRYGTLMHSKYIVAMLDQPKNHITGWVYIGSHNATQAAWGKATLSREKKCPKISMNNWELGVILPISDKGCDIRHLCNGLPVPFVRPAENYQADQEPWTQNLWT